MTENEDKLKKANNFYRLLEMVAAIAPVITTVLLVIILAFQIAALPYVLKILSSEQGQDSARASMFEYRHTRILTEQRILDNQSEMIDDQKQIMRKLDSILKRQNQIQNDTIKVNYK